MKNLMRGPWRLKCHVTKVGWHKGLSETLDRLGVAKNDEFDCCLFIWMVL